MRKTTPGIDRIQMQSMRRLKTELEVDIATHIHICHQCSKSQGDVYDMCAKWWQLSKQLHKVRRSLRAQERPVEGEQQTLPGM